MSNLFLFRSRDRLSDSVGSHNFTMNITNTPLRGNYALEFLNIQNTIYTIRTNYNDILYFNENSTNKSATITAGYYTSSTISAALKTALDSASGGFATFTVTFSTTTQKITISSTQDFSLKFATTDNSSARLLGFNNVNTNAATTVTSNNVVNFSDPLSINIFIAEANSSNFSSSNGGHGTFLVPIDVSFGGFKYYKSDDFKQIVNFVGTNKLSIQVRSMEGSNAVDLNASDWEFCLRKL